MITRKTKCLGLITLVLFVISIVVNWNEYRKPQDAQEGTEFLAGLDIARIQKIKLKSKEKVFNLEKSGDQYLLLEKLSYPAEPVPLNNLLEQFSRVTIHKIMGNKKSDQELFRVSDSDPATEVTLLGKDDAVLFHFFVGKVDKQGTTTGSYLRMKGQEKIYFSEAPLKLGLEVKDYLPTNILVIDKKDIQRLDFKGKQNFTILASGQSFVQEGVPEGKQDVAKVVGVVNEFQNCYVQEVQSRKNPEMASLRFDQSVTLTMNNKVIYVFEVATLGPRNFLKVQALVKDAQTEFAMGAAGTKENDLQVKAIEEALRTQTLAKEFNVKHGDWIYEIEATRLKNFTTAPSDFKK